MFYLYYIRNFQRYSVLNIEFRKTMWIVSATLASVHVQFETWLCDFSDLVTSPYSVVCKNQFLKKKYVSLTH